MTIECRVCHAMTQIREGEEPTAICDHCAQEFAADLGDWPAPLNECAYCGEPCTDEYCCEEHEEHRSMY